MPHGLFKSRFPIYDEIYILLTHMMDLYQARGVDVDPLKKGLVQYVKWLDEEKRAFNRKRKIPYRSLERKLLDLIRDKELISLIGNGKLVSFIESVAMDRATFDYVNLRF